MTVSLPITGDVGQVTGQLGLGHTAEDVAAMFTAAVLASTPPGSVAVGQPANERQTSAGANAGYDSLERRESQRCTFGIATTE